MGYYVIMSRKTENIHLSLNKINELEERLSDLNKQLNNREVDDIDFELRQELKNLRFWIDSLYFYNGKSTSNAKKTASRENGKKGGRPPKQITQMKRRLIEIDTLIPELEHKIQFAESDAEEENLNCQIKELKNESEKITLEIENWSRKSQN